MIGTGFFLLLCVPLLIITANQDSNSTLEVKPTKHVERNPSIDIDDISFANNTLVIKNISQMKYEVTISYLNRNVTQEYEDTTIEIDIDSLIRGDNVNNNHIALHLVQNDMRLPFSITISDVSTEYEYTYSPKHVNNGPDATLVSGKAAPVHPMGKVDVKIEDLTKWLYFNDTYMDTEDIQRFYNVVYDLSQFESSVYQIEQGASLPVIKNFKGLKYRIKSNIKADYYYLFATSEEQEVEEFVSEVISQGFPQAESNINNSLSCFRKADSTSGILSGYRNSGLRVLLLIAINRDWSKTIMPVGLVNLDNSGPQIIEGSDPLTDILEGRKIYNPHESLIDLQQKRNTQSISDKVGINSNLVFNKYGFEVIRQKTYSETLYVKTGHFYGNEANFIFEKRGHVEAITIEYGSTSRTYNVKDETSPFTINCWLPLNIGENHVTIKATDKLGNQSRHTHTINMVRVTDYNPDININNQIDIYN